MKRKRGLVDGLGSVFKFLTGNLDAADGERYEKIISKLQSAKDLNTQILNEHTHIMNDTLNDLEILHSNQKMIKSKLEKIIITNEEMARTFHIFTVRNILHEALFSLQLFLILGVNYKTL